MKNIKKYLAEGLLIIFSVLFALFINKLFDDHQTNKQKLIALASIKKELVTNEAILSSWKDKHIRVRERITAMVEGRNDSLLGVLKSYDYLNIGVLTNNESLMDAFLTNTAWEAAKTTGIISEFDFETTMKLTHVYNMQQVLTEKTMAKILDYYFDTSSHNMENITKVLTQFQLRFWELTEQEELMVHLYKEAIGALNSL